MQPNDLKRKIDLELIAFSIADCIALESVGVDRVELCDHQPAGGTTPSFGMIKHARKLLSAQLSVMIRPRGGDFCYTAEEQDVMLEDIRCCKELGVDGVVLGFLKEDQRIDIERLTKFVTWAYPLDCTFHRAFDLVPNPEEALEQIIQAGCTRILTSGLAPTAQEGKDRLYQLVKQAAGRIEIMAGSGIRAHNALDIFHSTGVDALHSSDISSAAEMKKILTLIQDQRQDSSQIP
jgi:copper homeostasis protein